MENLKITTVEMHTGGEPLRIITSGYPAIEGKTILDKQAYMRENLDHLRRLLMHEPRGHFDMYGVIEVKPDIDGADAAVIFMHNEGYSSMCGHATIALGRYFVDNKIVKYQEPEAQVNLQCPCGLVRAYVQCKNEKTGSVRFHSVPSFEVHLDHHFITPNYGKLKADIAYGGAFYCFLPLSAVGLSIDSPIKEITKAATEIKSSLNEQDLQCIHPFEKRLSYLYGVIFIDDHQSVKSRLFNLTVYAKAAVDRSPCGSATTARMALLFARKLIGIGEVVEFENPLTKSVFKAQVKDTTQYGNHNAVIVEVEGNGYYTGSATFTAENDDLLKTGFLVY